MKAIVYTSNTGSAASYAALLSDKTALPAYSLAEAKKQLCAGDEIIYLGWLMAGGIKGYKSAARRFRVRAVCAVGMSVTGERTEPVREQNAVPGEIPLFTLQGNFDLNSLRGAYRFMMKIMVKALSENLEKKTDRTPEEDDMLDMLLHGGERVSPENLKDVLDWYGKADADRG